MKNDFCEDGVHPFTKKLVWINRCMENLRFSIRALPQWASLESTFRNALLEAYETGRESSLSDEEISKDADEEILENKEPWWVEHIVKERERQEELKDNGKIALTCADKGMSNLMRLSVLAEEFGEVSRAVTEQANVELKYAYSRINRFEREALHNSPEIKGLKSELIQVAAVAVAWIEALEKVKEKVK